MAEIHVQARKHHANPSWMWAWIILGILIIAAVVYFVYTNKNNNNQNDTQQIQNDRNTPKPGAMTLPKSSNTTYVVRTA